MSNGKTMMKQNVILVFITLLCLTVYAGDTSSSQAAPHEHMLYFSLNNDKLLDVVNRMAAQKRVNVILPTDQKKLAETTVTFNVVHKITLAQAWELLVAMLNIAGFAICELDKSTYTIKPLDSAQREAAPLYVNTPIEVLPHSESCIRYLYYFQNINLKDAESKANLDTILKDMLPAQQSAQYMLDDAYNSLLITGNAQTIRSLMTILQELDQGGFREAIEVVPIVHTSAKEVADVLNALIPPRSQEEQFRFPLVAEPNKNTKNYFSASTRVSVIGQTNSIVVFGLQDSVQRVKDFVKKYLDKPLDADKTVLHVKQLRYLKAAPFAETLTKLIKQQAGQSTGETAGKPLGTVIIRAEQEEVAQDDQTKKIESSTDVGVKEKKKAQGITIGGNNLIIACTQRDWRILEKLIDQLDQEQWQVAIEVLIVDLTYEASNKLGTQLRRITNLKGSDNFKWQSAQLDGPLVDYTAGTYAKPDTTKIDSAAGIESDLLSQQSYEDSGYNLAQDQAAGSTILTFKDGNGIAAVISLLRNIEDAKIVSQPFLITKNNEPAKVESVDIRMEQGAVDQSSVGGTAVIKYFERKAATEVIIRPRISMPPDNINLEISVKANDFLAAKVITKRTVATNANVGHRQVLVLGGIARSSVVDSVPAVPVISRVPLLGYFFKSHTRQYRHRNLMIFVVPTRIAPVSVAGRGVSEFSHEKIDYLSKQFIKDSALVGCSKLFVKSSEGTRCLQDPIARLLFYPEDSIELGQALKDYEARGDWTEALAPSEPSERPATMAPKIMPKSISSDKLKTLLAQEENPLLN